MALERASMFLERPSSFFSILTSRYQLMTMGKALAAKIELAIAVNVKVIIIKALAIAARRPVQIHTSDKSFGNSSQQIKLQQSDGCGMRYK